MITFVDHLIGSFDRAAEMDWETPYAYPETGT